MTRHRSTVIEVGGVLLLLSMAVLPFLPLLEIWPWGSDALQWLGRGAPGGQWFAWVFEDNHFIGHRPLTAATYVLNNLVFGWSVAAYRGTDLALHALVVLGTWALARQLLPPLPAWLAGFAFALHPVSETIVPEISRRSYSLSQSLGLAALVCLERALQTESPSRRWGLCAVTLLAGSWLANETGYVLYVIALLRLLWPLSAWRRRVGLALATLPFFAVSLAWRWRVLGGAGGYQRFYLAYAEGGNLHLRRGEGPFRWEVAEAAVNYLVDPSGPGGAASLGSRYGLHGLLVVAALVVGALGLRAGWRLKSPWPALALLWMFGLISLYVLTGGWFWRQNYPLAGAFCLLGGFATLEVGRRPWLALVPLLFLPAWGWQSPVTQGIHLAPLRGDQYGSRIVNQTLRHLRGLPDRSTVWLAVPLRQRELHIARVWLSRATSERHLVFRVLATREGNTPSGRPPASGEVYYRNDRLRFRLNQGMTWYPGTATSMNLREDGEIWLDRLSSRKGESALFFYDEDGGMLQPLPPRLEGEDLPDEPAPGEPALDPEDVEGDQEEPLR